MFYLRLRLSIFALLLTGCSHNLRKLPTTGDESYCLVNYKTQTINCSYTSYRKCTEEYVKTPCAFCVKRSDLRNDLENNVEKKEEED